MTPPRSALFLALSLVVVAVVTSARADDHVAEYISERCQAMCIERFGTTRAARKTCGIVESVIADDWDATSEQLYGAAGWSYERVRRAVLAKDVAPAIDALCTGVLNVVDEKGLITPDVSEHERDKRRFVFELEWKSQLATFLRESLDLVPAQMGGGPAMGGLSGMEGMMGGMGGDGGMAGGLDMEQIQAMLARQQQMVDEAPDGIPTIGGEPPADEL